MDKSVKPPNLDVTLRNMLLEAGFDFSRPDPYIGWEIFRTFSEIPVHGITSDGLCFECGVFDFGDGADFLFDLYRQIQYAGDDEYFQIHCTFKCAPNSNIDALQKVLWFFAEDSPERRHGDAFFSEATALLEFQIGIQQEFTSCEVIMYETG